MKSWMILRGRSDYTSAAEYLPVRLSLTTLREAVQHCRGCDLYQHATQAVFGEGLKRSHIMLVGEKPGDQEDKQGKPFVGPAGRMLDKALREVDIPREEVYITNAVKHFKFTMRGKRRLHSKPSARQIKACRPWLEAEISVIRPQVIVALGATAAQSMYGSDFRLTRHRGEVFETEWAPRCMATVHPSQLLRMPDESSRKAAWEAFVEDFQVVAEQFRRA